MWKSLTLGHFEHIHGIRAHWETRTREKGMCHSLVRQRGTSGKEKHFQKTLPPDLQHHQPSPGSLGQQETMVPFCFFSALPVPPNHP